VTSKATASLLIQAVTHKSELALVDIRKKLAVSSLHTLLTAVVVVAKLKSQDAFASNRKKPIAYTNGIKLTKITDHR